MTGQPSNDRATSLTELAQMGGEAKAKQPAPPPSMPTLGDAAYHGLAGQIVRRLEPNTEAHPAALLVQLLAGFGNAVGTSPYLLTDGAKQHARLFVVAVGPSARGRKGTSWGNINMIFRHADETWATDRIVGGLASGEGLIAAVSDHGDDDGPAVDKRLLVKESEFVRALAACGRDGSTLSAIIRDAFDDGNLAVLTRREPLRAKGAHISIIGHVTGDELRAKLTSLDVANGFGNRFLYAAIQRTQLLPFGGDLEEDDYRDMGRQIRTALHDARKIGRMRFATDARTKWAELYELIDQQARQATGLVEGLTSRADAQTIRLAITYALLDGSPEVKAVHLDAAWAVWTFSRESVEFLFGDRIGLTNADRVVQAITSAGGRLDRTGIHGALSNHLSKDELDVIVDVLVRDGRIMTEDVPTGGRPRKDYVVVEQQAA